MQNIFRLVLVVAGSMFLYRFRFRVINTVLGQPWIRRIAVSLAMELPFLRQRFMRQFL